jgi:uncharacterized protein (UPF0276 family)
MSVSAMIPVPHGIVSCLRAGGFPAQPPAGTGLPRRAGAGFKPQHLHAWLADAQAPAFAEVHAENFMGAGGAPHQWLTALRERMPLSLHGVGLSIGAESPLDLAHLERLARLVERYQPAAFSEHLAWSTHGGVYYNDLLPLTYDAGTLDRVCAHIDQVQSRLRLQILLENPSTYFEFEASSMGEPEFIARVIERTGCGLLLDVNNVHVSCHNNQRNPRAYLDALPMSAVGEIHLAGYAEEVDADGATLLIDNHGAPVAQAVWELYARVLAVTGPIATLIEWDHDVPHYARLRTEVARADAALHAADVIVARVA